MTTIDEFERDRHISQLRLSPHSIEGESSAPGGLLPDTNAPGRVPEVLASDAFSVTECPQSQGKPEEIGSLADLNSLVPYVPSACKIQADAQMVRDRSILGRTESANDGCATSAFYPKRRPERAVVDESEPKIFKFGKREPADHPNKVTGVPTGFVDLDRMTAGLQAGDLVVLAAQPYMGATALAINIAEHVALNEGLAVAVFSMEIDAARLAMRIVGSIGRIDQGHLRTGKLTNEEWPRLAQAMQRLRNTSLHIDESAGLTSSELCDNARRLSRQCGKLGLIVVDHLQLMKGSGGDGENRAPKLGEVSPGLKMLARELQCPVIVLCPLNTSVETRTDKRPRMSDLRESGAREQDADTIMFVYRDEYYTKHAGNEPGVAEIIIAKQRNGPTGVIKLGFLRQLAKFENLANAAYDH